MINSKGAILTQKWPEERAATAGLARHKRNPFQDRFGAPRRNNVFLSSLPKGDSMKVAQKVGGDWWRRIEGQKSLQDDLEGKWEEEER